MTEKFNWVNIGDPCPLNPKNKCSEHICKKCEHTWGIHTKARYVFCELADKSYEQINSQKLKEE